MERRDFLKYAGAGAVGILVGAGCFEEGEDPSQSEHYERVVMDEVDTEFTIPEGGWFDYAFEFNKPGFIEYTAEVTDGPQIESLVMPYKMYDGFVDKYDLDIVFDRYEGELNRHDSEYLRDSGDLEPDEYIFILDNSRRGETVPPDQQYWEEKTDHATVELEIKTGVYERV